MATSTEGVVGRGALLIGHAAGMLDLVSMPLWVGVLIQFRHMSPSEAGLLITAYMIGVFLTSVALAPRFDRLPARLIAIGGFIRRGSCFFCDYQCRRVCGACAGAFHGRNRRRIGSVDGARHDLPERSPAPALCHRQLRRCDLLDCVLRRSSGCGAAQPQRSLLRFRWPADPRRDRSSNRLSATAGKYDRLEGKIGAVAGAVPFRLAVILAFVGVALLSAGQGQTYAFLERIGSWRGFPASDIGHMLVVSGFLNLLAPIVAALLENAVPRLGAICVALLIHAGICIAASNSTVFLPYAAAGSLLVFMTIFNHTFMFGTIAKLDPSGRAASSTPAMLTLGAAIGPALGGAVAQFAGFAAIGWVSAVILIASAVCFVLIGSLRAPALQPGTA